MVMVEYGILFVRERSIARYRHLLNLPVTQGFLARCYQVFADQRPTLELRALTIDQPYSFTIEAFNESGVSKVSKPVRISFR